VVMDTVAASGRLVSALTILAVNVLSLAPYNPDLKINIRTTARREVLFGRFRAIDLTSELNVPITGIFVDLGYSYHYRLFEKRYSFRSIFSHAFFIDFHTNPWLFR